MPSLCVLAFDFGTKNIGVAIGNTTLRQANPLSILKARDGIPNWDDIQRLITEWQAQQLIVGLPLNMDGSVSEMSTRARKFGQRLHGRFGLPVDFIDERLSSYEAKDMADALGHRGDYKNKPIDALAAAIVLDSWFATTQ